MKSLILFVLTIVVNASFAQNIINIPLGDSVNIDGIMEVNEWVDSDSVVINFSNNKKVNVYYKHDGGNLLACYKGDLESANVRFPEILLDMEFDRSNIFQADDWWFHVSSTDCEYKGRYGHYVNCELERPNWKAVNNIIFGEPITDLVEIEIPFSTINLNINTIDTIGISFLITNTAHANHHWPIGAHRLYPITWGKAVFDKNGLGIYTPKPEQFQVFPNPSNDKIFLKFNSQSEHQNEFEIIIYTIYGKNVLQLKYDKEGIDVSDLSSGLYYIEYKHQIRTFIKK